MFERSRSGQQNRAFFYGVDYICYVEGGGGSQDWSLDATFWKEVISTFRPNLSIKFLPKGGKPVLEALAKEIINDNLQNTLVAMDTDYDRLTGDVIMDPRVLYTFGYSWENDVLDRSCLFDIILTLTHRADLNDSAREKFVSGYADFSHSCRRAILADSLALSAKSSVLPRQAPGRIIKAVSGTGLPVIDRKELIKLTAAANAATKPRIRAASSVISGELRYFVGHCLSHGIAMLVRAVMREVGFKKAVATDHIRDIAVLLFSRQLSKKPPAPVAEFHALQCAAIP